MAKARAYLANGGAVVVDTAIERGFTHYGLSEHCPRYRAQDLYPGEEKLGIAGLAAAFEAYVARALDLRDARAGEIELFVGFETETLPPEGWLQAMMTVRDAYPFDYIVGSVHDICGRWVDFSPADTAALTADLGGPEALQIAYFRCSDEHGRIAPARYRCASRSGAQI